MPLIGRKLVIDSVTVTNDTSDPVGVELSAQDNRLLRPLGMGLESRVRSHLLDDVERPFSVYMESSYVNTIERTLGMPRDSNANLFTFKTSAGKFQVSSSSANDTAAGTGMRTIVINGLHWDGASATDISETITLNGQTPVSFTSALWWRVNKMYVVTSGTTGYNEGDIYISDDGAATTNGIPDVGVDVRNAMIAGFSSSTAGIYSVKTGFRFNYTRGNSYTTATSANPLVIRETGWWDWNGTYTNLSFYQVGYLGSTGNVSYNFDGAAPYFEHSDLDLRVYTESGVIEKGAVLYYEVMLTPNAQFTS